jgi:uncharacterized protein (TIGR03663 family)
MQITDTNTKKDLGNSPNPSGSARERALFSSATERFFMAAMAILIVGIALRQINLGPAPFHPDEAIHTNFSQGFINYKYNPVFHGPLLYHLVGSVFGLFGQHDYTARLVPSLLGIVLIWMILFPARQFLGNRAAIIAGALVAVSPSIVVYSRHLLHDSLVLVLTLGAVLCFAVTLQKNSNETIGRNARIGLMAFLSLFLATKANCFFIMVMLLVFWFAWRFAGKINLPVHISKFVPPLCFAAICLSAFIFPRETSLSDAVKHTQHLVFQIISVAACGLMFLWILTRKTDENERQFKRQGFQHSDIITYLLALAAALWIYLFLFGGFAQVLLQWAINKELPIQTFSDGIRSARSAIFEMLSYWGGQQNKPRLAGRHDYYMVLGLLYELPIYLAMFGGIWHAAKNRSAFTDLLMWWAFTSWAVYSVANEKVPWLLVHIALPFALLSSIWLASIKWKKPVLLVTATLAAAFCLRSNSAFIFERAGDNAEPMLYAQTPDEFRDALDKAMSYTRGDLRLLWMESERQWPTVWYWRENKNDNNPLRGQSGLAIAGMPDFNTMRVGIGQEKDLGLFHEANFNTSSVNFLIWPRASWTALQPHRYWKWFITRDTLPEEERKDFKKGKTTILAGYGEWSHAIAVIGWRK